MITAHFFRFSRHRSCLPFKVDFLPSHTNSCSQGTNTASSPPHPNSFKSSTSALQQLHLPSLSFPIHTEPSSSTLTRSELGPHHQPHFLPSSLHPRWHPQQLPNFSRSLSLPSARPPPTEDMASLPHHHLTDHVHHLESLAIQVLSRQDFHSIMYLLLQDGIQFQIRSRVIRLLFLAHQSLLRVLPVVFLQLFLEVLGVLEVLVAQVDPEARLDLLILTGQFTAFHSELSTALSNYSLTNVVQVQSSLPLLSPTSPLLSSATRTPSRRSRP